MANPRAAAPTPDEPGYFEAPSVLPGLDNATGGVKKNRKRIALWVCSGLAGLSVSVGTLGLLLVQTTTEFGVPTIAAPAAPEPLPSAPRTTPAAPDGTPAAETPATGQPAPETPRTTQASAAPRSSAAVTAPAPDPLTDVIVRLTPRKDETTVIPTDGLAPGDQVAAAVSVKNDGNVDLRYSMVSSATTPSGDLAAQAITMVVKVNVTHCNSTGFNQSGTVVYSGPLGSYAGRKVIGDPTRGAQPGDRLLSPGEVETICVNVTMPSNVGNEYQGASTRVRFRFDSENVG